jgi:hypothetical protein
MEQLRVILFYTCGGEPQGHSTAISLLILFGERPLTRRPSGNVAKLKSLPVNRAFTQEHSEAIEKKRRLAGRRVINWSNLCTRLVTRRSCDA